MVVEGLSFHVGSQCANFDNFVQALNIAAAVMEESESRGHRIKILDIGGGFPIKTSLTFQYDYKYMIEQIVEKRCGENGKEKGKDAKKVSN